MDTREHVILGFIPIPPMRQRLYVNGAVSYDRLYRHLSDRNNLNGRLLLYLKQYLEQKFDRVDVTIDIQRDDTPLEDVIARKMNRSELDILVNPLIMDGKSHAAFDRTYPHEVSECTFVTRNPSYSPHIFGIFQTFSLSVWIHVAVVFLMMILVCHFVMRRKWNSCEILLNIFAILMKQNAQKVPSSFAEKILVYSWVVGAMVLCLSYDSVFLSFLSFPPLTKIKHLSDLASAVRHGEYHCLAYATMELDQYFLDIKEENLEVISKDISKNYPRFYSLWKELVLGNNTMKIAYFTQINMLHIFEGNFFVSEDRFYKRIGSMAVRKEFCCKEMLGTFIHRLLATGIYSKYLSDFNFQNSFSMRDIFAKRHEKVTTNRKLTLTDVAPAFIFLLCGYFIAILALIWEIFMNRKREKLLKRRVNRSKRKNHNETAI